MLSSLVWTTRAYLLTQGNLVILTTFWHNCLNCVNGCAIISHCCAGLSRTSARTDTLITWSHTPLAPYFLCVARYELNFMISWFHGFHDCMISWFHNFYCLHDFHDFHDCMIAWFHGFHDCMISWFHNFIIFMIAWFYDFHYFMNFMMKKGGAPFSFD